MRKSIIGHEHHPIRRLLASRMGFPVGTGLDISEPIREVRIHGEAFAASRLSMMRIMARRMNAATVVA
jgi:hypothetical protein